MNNHQFDVIYEDDNLIAVNKVSGLTTGGDRWDHSEKRLDQLLDKYLGKKVYMLHRIDKDTSGLVIFGKNAATHRAVGMAFEGRLVSKTYLAIIHGRPNWTSDASGEATCVCGLPLVPNGDKRHRTIVDKYHGKLSLTRFKLILSAGNYSLVEAYPETGRTHQIRVHLAALGHPIVCDRLYGKQAFRSEEPGVYLSSFKPGWRGDAYDEKPLLNRLGLHAWKLSLPLAIFPEELRQGKTENDLHFEAPLQKDMKALINQMKKVSQ
ncbi:MAG: RluA family pseudouridine synthase [Spirochaetaceae bacterium]|jgi:RluA family pseudouridine synthase|nr:RluA family pseudouridine synthase [Spirochaetaceae bacterium]